MARNGSKRPFRIGLTGGIASGKSVVAEMFAKFGVPVIDTDVIARKVVANGQPVLDEIRARFGEQMINKAGNLDRAALRRLIFADDEARADLDSILHPRISAETRRQSDESGGEYQVIVVPLLVGSSLLDFVDRVLVVDCEEDTQVDRLIARDRETIEQAKRMVASQSSRKERLAIADDVIDNDLGLDKVRNQVEDFHKDYRRRAAN